MRGIAYGVGVGPGDPELMTLKAIRLIRENNVIALPGRSPRDSVAYKIAVQAVPELADKKLISIYMPMVKNREQLQKEHRKGAALLKEYLDRGENVVYLALGDPTIYCSFSYLQHLLEDEGYTVRLVSGVPSFCAAAARLNMTLAEWDEPLHILPAMYKTDDLMDRSGNYVLMKSGTHMKEVREMLRRNGRNALAVLNCGMDNEILCRSMEEIPDDAGYYSLIISKAF